MLALSAPISIVRRAKMPFAHGVMSPRLHPQHNSRAAIFGHQHPTIGNLTTPWGRVRSDVISWTIAPISLPTITAGLEDVTTATPSSNDPFVTDAHIAMNTKSNVLRATAQPFPSMARAPDLELATPSG